MSSVLGNKTSDGSGGFMRHVICQCHNVTIIQKLHAQLPRGTRLQPMMKGTQPVLGCSSSRFCDSTCHALQENPETEISVKVLF